MRDFRRVKRVVVKIGTSVLTEPDGSLDRKYMKRIAKQIHGLTRQGLEVVIVSSGAIGSGVKELGLKTVPRDVPTKQGAAAVGQSILIEAWRKALNEFGLKVAQILLTYENFSNRRTYLNLRNSMEILTKHRTIPIINENDPISVHEIEETFGDNDKLSALVASKIDAELLFLLTDVNGLYDRNPRHKDARLITEVDKITALVEQVGGDPGSWRSKGGMKTKIEAAKITMKSGCDMIIANAHEKNVLSRIIGGERLGTCFNASKSHYTNKERWIRLARKYGIIEVDEGANEALLRSGSLLPSGIVNVKGDFDSGVVVSIVHKDREVAKGIVEYSSKELEKIKGEHSNQIEKILGYRNHESVIRRENMVVT